MFGMKLCAAPRVAALLASGKVRLPQARNTQKTPVVDWTGYADRNGMMISAYLGAANVLGREDLKVFARKGLACTLARLRSDDGSLYHALSEGRAYIAVWRRSGDGLFKRLV